MTAPADTGTDAQRGWRSALLLGGALVLLLVVGRLWWAPAHASLNLNEGWNAGQAQRALGAGPLYPAPDALIANNYPPLSFFVVGAVGRLFGDDILAGRVLSLLAQVATAAAIFALVRRLGAGARWAWVGVLVYGAYAATLLRSYVAMNDPQWLAHALMSWGLVALTPARAGDTPATLRLIAAAALMVCGGLVKHNLVAFPLAVTLWLARVDRRALLRWLLAAGVLALAAAAALYAIWGAAVFKDVAGAARSYSAVRMAAKGGPFLLALLPGALACLPLWRTRRDDPRRLLPLLLLAVAAPIGVVQSSGDGVSVNAFFEGVIALATAVPLGLALRPEPAGRWLALTLLPALCLLPAAAAADLKELRGRDAAAAEAGRLQALIARSAGPVACDDQALCYWAGRQSALDFFAWKQRLLRGGPGRLGEAVAQRRFALVAMRATNPGWHDDRLRPLIRSGYAVAAQTGGTQVLVPIPSPAAP